MENNEKGGLKIYFNAFYTPEYVNSLKGDILKQNKMIQFHDTLVSFLELCKLAGKEFKLTTDGPNMDYE